MLPFRMESAPQQHAVAQPSSAPLFPNSAPTQRPLRLFTLSLEGFTLLAPSFEGSLEGCSSLCALCVSSFLFALRNVAALTHGIVTSGSSTKLVWYTRCVALR